MNESPRAAQITGLLHEWQGGSQDAFERLVPLVYDELHTLASRQLKTELGVCAVEARHHV
jgi:hypothetical protein